MMDLNLILELVVYIPRNVQLLFIMDMIKGLSFTFKFEKIKYDIIQFIELLDTIF
jgi:hypothetical protein